MEERLGLRLYGGLLIGAAVLGAAVNGLHPVTTGDLTVTAATIAGDGTWVALHIGIMLSILLLAAGLWGVVPYTFGTPGAPFARVAVLMTAIGATLGMASLAIDGITLNALADAWAAASPNEAPNLLAHFTTAKRINTGLWATTVLVFFGIAVLAHGMALMRGGLLPKWQSAMALTTGAASLLSGLIQIPDGGESRVGELLFTASAFLLTLWALLLGYRWWRTPPELIAKSTTTTSDPHHMTGIG
jgi:hypothetical protein